MSYWLTYRSGCNSRAEIRAETARQLCSAPQRIVNPRDAGQLRNPPLERHRPAKAMGRRALLRMDQPKPPPLERRRGYHRLRNSLPLRRSRPHPHQALGAIKMTSGTDSKEVRVTKIGQLRLSSAHGLITMLTSQLIYRIAHTSCCRVDKCEKDVVLTPI